MTGLVKLPDIRPPHPELVLWAGGSKRLASLLQRRGITSRGEVEHLLDPLALPEPDLGDYPQLVLALERIQGALANQEKIAIYGDYDVDGITATTVLVSALKELSADVIWHIPNRFSEGYGMDASRVEKMAAAGTKLIITCDCGISNVQEIALANNLGVDVIVTDHHTPPEILPPALAIVNFKQLAPGHPSRDLPGVGTAFVLARELLQAHGKDAENLLDLVALGVIADVVPLRGHSRQLYKRGLPVLNSGNRPGLAALFSVANLSPGLIDEEKLGFQVAPRINAAGRLDDGGIAVEMLLADKKELAASKARELDQLNMLRKELGKSIMAGLETEPGKPVVAYQDDWHQGVIGIAAGQLCSANNAPALLMTKSTNGEAIVGSARSVEGIDIYKVLKGCSKILDKFGGHPAAAGFSLSEKNLPSFIQAAKEVLAEEMLKWNPPPIEVDLVLEPGEVNLELTEELSRLAPWGEGNPRPLLYCSGLTVKSVRAAGSGHILVLGDRWRSFTAGLWDGGPAPDAGASIGAVFTVSEDLYRGERSVWATITGWWPGQERPQFKEMGPDYVDMRGKPWATVLKKYPGAAVYREGIHWQDHPGNTRNNIPVSSTLVLLTPPPSPAVLRQIIAMAEPELVVLAYSQTKGQITGEFLAAIKYVLTSLAGIAQLGGLAAALGQDEETILAGLRLLSISQIIDFQIFKGKIILQRLEKTQVKPGSQLNRFKFLAEETKAFQDWLNGADLSEIKKIRI